MAAGRGEDNTELVIDIPIDFPGWQELLQRFRQEVMDHEREDDT